MAQARTNFKCFRCAQIVVGSYSSLTKHLRHVHAMKTSSTSQAHLVCAKTKKHEIGMFCFRILNLPMTENSKLVNIFPIAIGQHY
jgi:hypothetical protein